MTTFRHGHSMTRSPTYRSWMSMRTRCNCPTQPKFMRYGGRGIRVCKRWDDFATFLADMGERPEGTSIDRINNDGDYEPENCRWATKAQQLKNRRYPGGPRQLELRLRPPKKKRAKPEG